MESGFRSSHFTETALLSVTEALRAARSAGLYPPGPVSCFPCSDLYYISSLFMAGFSSGAVRLQALALTEATVFSLSSAESRSSSLFTHDLPVVT